MAEGFAGLLAQQASSSIGNANAGRSAQEGIQQGAQLALQREQIQQQRQKLEQAKAQAQDAKVGKFNDALFKITNLKDPKARNAYLRKIMPRVRDSWGLGEMLSDDALENLTVSEENLGRYAALQLAVRSGEMSHTDAMQIANDEVRLAEINPVPLEMLSDKATDITDAQESFLNRQQKDRAEAGRDRRARQTSADTTTKEFTQQVTGIRKELTQEMKPLEGAEREFTQAQNTMQDMMTRINRGEKLTQQDSNRMQVLLSNISRTALNYQGRIPVTDTERMANRYGMQGRIKDIAEWFISRPITPDRAKLMAQFVDDGYQSLRSAMRNTLDSYDEAIQATPILAGNLDQARQATRLTAKRQQLGFEIESDEQPRQVEPRQVEPRLQGPSGQALPDPRQPQYASRIMESINQSPNSVQALKVTADAYGLTVDELMEILNQSAQGN